ncbi:MAG: NTP transferase domain-containing protein, partial [Candidatus Zapsychrus exili]|nr:NTP transferase domain-containing protein [Candidatus Zapsychrus exili]
MKNKAQVVILCGGRGTRLKPATNEIPKPLIELNGKPILDYVIDFYKKNGFSRILLCVGYKGEKIRQYYSKPSRGVKISFSDAGEKASMLKRLWKIRDEVENTFFISYGDTL